MLDKDSERRLWRTKNRERYFFIPQEHELAPGEDALLTAGRRPQKADLSALAAFEIPREDANAWIGQRVRAGFASAGAAWDRFVGVAAQSTNADVPPQKTTVDPESVLGMSPEALADDPTRTREAVQNALRWASTRLNKGQNTPRPAAPDLAQKLPALAGALQKLGHSIQQAGKRMEENAAPKPLRRVGFFRELRHSGGHGPSLHAARSDAPPPHAARILAYLDSGHTLIASPGVTRDVLSQQRGTHFWNRHRPDRRRLGLATGSALLPGRPQRPAARRLPRVHARRRLLCPPRCRPGPPRPAQR